MSEPINNAIEQLSNAVSDVVKAAITVEDFVLKTKAPVEFLSQDSERDVYGLGLQWKATGTTKQFIFRANPDRYWSSESVDLRDGHAYMIANNPVITQDGLGAGIKNSNLSTVGVLRNLRTSGDLSVDDFIFYNSASERLGIGTDAPSGSLSIASIESEFTVDVSRSTVKIGTFTANDLAITTGNTPRLIVTATGNISIPENTLHVGGRIGIGIHNPPMDASITAIGPIRFQGRKHEIGNLPTHGSYKKGDIVWNEDPRPTGNVGWVCVREGTPGEWKAFGQISS